MTAVFWLIFAAACLVCLVAVPVSMRLEERAVRRSRRVWRRMGGGRL